MRKCKKKTKNLENSERTVHHFHDGEVEELLQGPQTQLAVAQQQRPALVNEHVLRQLLLHDAQDKNKTLNIRNNMEIIKQGKSFVSVDESHPYS